MKRSHWSFFLIVFSIFLIVISPKQWADGMFLDGMLYATVARNMANGLGSFWTPYYTASWDHFYEHPPLVFWLQSLLFKVIGDSIYVERLYSFLTFVATGGIIVLIWKKVAGEFSYGWVALLLWISIPTVFWAASNNMLENTMMIFTSLAVYFYLLRDRGFYFLIAAGFMVFLGLLSKGVFALFVWSAPFWLFVTRRDTSFFKMVIDSVVIILCTLLPLFLFLKLDQAALQNLDGYLTNQVVGSVENVRTVPHRYTVIIKMINDLLPAIAIALIFFSLQYFKKVKNEVSKGEFRWAVFFLLVGLSGVVPIMISLKQRSFYILATFPFFSLAFAFVLWPGVRFMVSALADIGWKRIERGALLIFGVAIVMSVSLSGGIARDKDELMDVYSFLKVIPRDATIGLSNELASKYEAYAMFGRYGNITLIPGFDGQYVITKKDAGVQPDGYKKISNVTYYYDLYEKE